MSGIWFRILSEGELSSARAAMITNKVAGESLAIPSWRRSIFGCVLYSILRIFAYCARHFVRSNTRLMDGAGPVYLYFTPSCELAVRSIEREFPGSVIGFKGRNALNFPLRRCLVATLCSFASPALWRWIVRDVGWRPWISDAIFYLIVLRWSEQFFAKLPPQTLIYTNDHCCFDRGIVDAAARLGHKTVYVQHSSVTDIFPPLTAHYSLLDGQRALQTYAEIAGSRGTALLCGRQYEIAAVRKSRHATNTALVCISTIDTVKSWMPVLEQIRDAQYRILLRTHPSERKLEPWKRLVGDLGAHWLDPRKNSLASSLEQASVVFAGQSGVLLEANLSGAISVLVQFDEDTRRGLHDWFGFAAHGIACLIHPKDTAAIMQKIKNGSEVVSFSAAAYFDLAATLDENMQVKAVKWILNGGDIKDSVNHRDFIFSKSESRNGIRVYLPKDLGFERINKMKK